MKQFFLSATLLLAVTVGFGQTFMNGLGVKILVASSAGSGNNIGPSITYSPRINFVETEQFSLSAGIPLTIGFTVSASAYDYDYDYYSSSSSVGLIFNAPLMLNFNMGRGSTKENDSKFGFFLGGGYGYHRGDFVSDYYDPNYDPDGDGLFTISGLGPAAHAGLRFGVGRKHRNIEVNFSYMSAKDNSKSVKQNVTGVGCLFNF